MHRRRRRLPDACDVTDPTGDPTTGRDAATPGATRATYVEACQRIGRDEVLRLRVAVAEREAELGQLGARIRAVGREHHRARQRLAEAERTAASDQARFERDFDALMALPHVHQVDVDGARIRVTTDAVDIEHDGQEYRLGRYAIDIDIDRGIHVTNLENTSASTGWDHPHVQGTVPCLGNLQEGCELLLGQLEIVPLSALLLQFLDTYNPATAYGPITLWAAKP